MSRKNKKGLPGQAQAARAVRHRRWWRWSGSTPATRCRPTCACGWCCRSSNFHTCRRDDRLTTLPLAVYIGSRVFVLMVGRRTRSTSPTASTAWRSARSIIAPSRSCSSPYAARHDAAQLQASPSTSGIPPVPGRRRAGRLLRRDGRRRHRLPLVQHLSRAGVHGRRRRAGAGRRARRSGAVRPRTSWSLPIIGGVFFARGASASSSRSRYFKLTGKRIFLMAPIHHHFEKRAGRSPELSCVFG